MDGLDRAEPVCCLIENDSGVRPEGLIRVLRAIGGGTVCNVGPTAAFGSWKADRQRLNVTTRLSATPAQLGIPAEGHHSHDAPPHALKVLPACGARYLISGCAQQELKAL